MTLRGKFITVEGGEGGGKSTNIPFIRDVLLQAGKQVVLTREPGGTKLGEAVRGVLLDTQYKGMAHECELLLVFAARAQHLAEVIQPALQAGKWVLSDRFTDATYAYQGAGRGISVERIAQLETFVQGSLRPDVTLLLDLPVAVGMARASRRGEHDRFEQERVDFFERVRNGYLARVRSEPGRFRVIDAAAALAQVQQSIEAALAEILA